MKITLCDCCNKDATKCIFYKEGMRSCNRIDVSRLVQCKHRDEKYKCKLINKTCIPGDCPIRLSRTYQKLRKI